ncbi:MAG: PstS family phosphate ABC transporter substrate-binding protein [Oscillatoriales cyanobacterium SM2_2_1]|nr:PstS family phosphate ABC transporter substrate-binding protein [Oscillatoriales cyanobacterium SM2_2_1]
MRSTVFKFAAAALTVSTVASFAPAQAQQAISIDGSSTVFPILEVAASEFQKNSGGIRVTVALSGTGGGFRKFCNGETDISNASRPIAAREIEACNKNGTRYIEMPIAFDGLAVVVNPQNTWARDLTSAELKRVWEPGSKLNNWSQVRQGFPNVPLRLFGPGTASGTFDYFTEAIVGKSRSSRTDFTASEDDNVLVQGVSRDRGALGFFGKAYYNENKTRVRAVAIVNESGRAVLPTDQTVSDGSYNPLSRPMFIYVSERSAKRPEVRRFVTFLMNSAPSLVKKADYIPFTRSQYSQILTIFNRNRVGTVFGGKNQVGVRISEILSRSAQ